MGLFSSKTETSPMPKGLDYVIDDLRISDILNAPLSEKQSQWIRETSANRKHQDAAAGKLEKE